MASQFVDCRGTLYNCAEQYMMAEKALLFDDLYAYDNIMKVKNPRKQKSLGRQAKNFDLEIWKENAKLIVYRGNMYKFGQNQELAEQMLNTGSRYFVEASPYDKIWGVGLKEDDPLILDYNNWLGTNWLGDVLTQVRNDLRC